MELSTIFMNRLANSEGATGTAADSRNRRASYSGANFSDFIAPAKSDNTVNNSRLERADNRNQPRNEFKRSTEKARNDETKRNDVEAGANRRSKPDNSVKDNKQTEAREQNHVSKNTDTSAKKVEDKPVEDVKDEEVTSDNSQVLNILNAIIVSDNEIKSELSEILNVSEEQINNALNELNMSSLDLLDKGNLSSFMQKIMDIQDPVQLLSVPGIAAVYEEINSLLGGYSEQVESLKNMNFNELTADLPQEASLNEAVLGNSDGDTIVDAQLEPTDINVADSLKNAIDGKITDSSDMGSTPVATVKSIFQMLQTKVTGIKDFVQTDKIDAGAVAADAITQAEQQAGKPLEVNVALNDDHNDGFLEQNPDMYSDSRPVSPNAVQTNGGSSFAEKIRSESARNINHADVVNQIIEKLKIEIRGNVTEMKLTLKPEHLGDVTLKVQTQNGIVTAQFLAENQRIKEIIEANFNQLRDVLQEQGINISQLTVSIGGQETQGRESGSGYQQQNSNGTGSRTADMANEATLEETEDDVTRGISNSRVNYTV